MPVSIHVTTILTKRKSSVYDYFCWCDGIHCLLRCCELSINTNPWLVKSPNPSGRRITEINNYNTNTCLLIFRKPKIARPVYDTYQIPRRQGWTSLEYCKSSLQLPIPIIIQQRFLIFLVRSQSIHVFYKNMHKINIRSWTISKGQIKVPVCQ